MIYFADETEIVVIYKVKSEKHNVTPIVDDVRIIHILRAVTEG